MRDRHAGRGRLEVDGAAVGAAGRELAAVRDLVALDAARRVQRAHDDVCRARSEQRRGRVAQKHVAQHEERVRRVHEQRVEVRARDGVALHRYAAHVRTRRHRPRHRVDVELVHVMHHVVRDGHVDDRHARLVRRDGHRCTPPGARVRDVVRTVCALQLAVNDRQVAIRAHVCVEEHQVLLAAGDVPRLHRHVLCVEKDEHGAVRIHTHVTIDQRPVLLRRIVSVRRERDAVHRREVH